MTSEIEGHNGDLCCESTQIDPHSMDLAATAIPNDEIIYKVTEIFSALADSTRFKILSSLAAGELCVCELVELCEVSQSAVSHQLRLLRDRGLVRARRDGQRAVYSLADGHVRSLIVIGIEHAHHAQIGGSHE
jgi:DNA-binding transcriptional ArsR family regulator